jgi:hypothetical protein
MTARASALRALAVSLVCLGIHSATFSQSQPEDHGWRTERWIGDVAFGSANSLIAGLSAGVIQELRGGSFRDGFTRGALGGAVAYGGRRVAAEGFWGAGLVGRQVSAVGISIARNAAERQPSFSQLWLPIGPVTVQLRYGEELTVSARADVYASAWMLAAVLDDRLTLDVESSFSSGAPVFRAPDYQLRRGDHSLGGMAVGGVVVTGHHSDNLRPDEILAHERVHVLQYDFAQLLWGDPLEELVGRHVPYLSIPQRHVRFGALLPVLADGLGRLIRIDGPSTYWELEAYYLDER